MFKKIGIFGKTYKNTDCQYFNILVNCLKKHHINFVVEKKFAKVLKHLGIANTEDFESFEKESIAGIDLLITLGGDGTILNAMTFIKDTEIPVLGINMGKLGFLATVQKKEIERVMYCLIKKEFSIHSRSVLQVHTNNKLQFENSAFALNEISITRKNSTSMIGVKVHLNEEYLTTYWADGLIVATPTGSTGYSLSCQGPILTPQSNNFIITPISPHNLNARPIVLPDNTIIKLSVISRNENYLLSLDSRLYSIDEHVEIILKKAYFPMNLIQLDKQTFIQTLRDKMFFGEDIRNTMID